MTELERLALRHRRQVLALERAAVRPLVARWRHGRDRVVGLLAALDRKVAAARAAGRPVHPDWLRRQAEYRAVLAAAQDEIERLVAATASATNAAAAAAVPAGVSSAAAALDAAGAAVATPGRAVLADLVALTTDPRSPVRAILADMAAGTATTVDAIGTLITDGIVTGAPLNRTAREVSRALGGQFARARTVVRTETLRVYRTAQVETYDTAGADGWVWVAALDTRTCTTCWAMHGTVFPTSEPMGTHPNCRCVTIPQVDGVTPTVEPGPVAFARLPAADQAAILGPSRYRAWRDGAVTLDDLVAEHHSPVWGTTRTVASLRSALGAEEARRFYRARR